MSSYVLGFADIDQSKRALVGGKGANLGELAKLEGIRVPDGFCVTTEAFQRMLAASPAANALLDQLARPTMHERDTIEELSGAMRRVIEALPLAQGLTDEIARFLSRLGENRPYAVRSSATAEDSPTASFAGQQETYLNVAGGGAILEHIRKCWASLFTARAVTYRLQQGFDRRDMQLAVVVQEMVFPQAAGVLFTADPVTANRKVASIEASFGLGEAVVAGLVNADRYQVRDGAVTDKQISTKTQAIYAASGGGTQAEEIAPKRQQQPALTDAQIVQLARIGRKIEAHFGSPQDIEWCLVDETFYIVQARPITTLYPIPEADDRGNHVYISVGHQQMMTDAMKPLGLSFFQLTASRPMYQAGGRLFVDITPELASPVKRAILVAGMGQHDPLIKDAVTAILERGDFIPSAPDDKQEPSAGKSTKERPTAAVPPPGEPDPAIVSALIASNQRSIAALKHTIQTKSGSPLLDFILEDIQELKKILFNPQSTAVFMAAINAATWINEKMNEWLGEKNAADTLSQSVPNNITSEMGLALLDVADVIRPYPEVIACLQQATEDSFLDDLGALHGGREARDAICAYLDQYGMRCVGEIDITKPRWSEKPTTLLPLILSDIKNFAPHESRRKFEEGRQQALQKELELLDRLRQAPDGERKAEQTKQMINVLRTYIGYREYPKYGMISRYFVYKEALLREAERLVRAGVLQEKEDVFYLSFEELRAAVGAKALDHAIIRRRKDEYRFYERLTPPRVITSDGEIFTGEYKRENLPAGAMAGLAVSAGVVEGRARVILSLAEADLEEGDILVTAFTDPSWTPLFISIKGLVTEVGGLMTHGAVIAREYGIPAVVGVEHATKRIRDGQRIRVHGTEGYVEFL